MFNVACSLPTYLAVSDFFTSVFVCFILAPMSTVLRFIYVLAPTCNTVPIPFLRRYDRTIVASFLLSSISGNGHSSLFSVLAVHGLLLLLPVNSESKALPETQRERESVDTDTHSSSSPMGDVLKNCRRSSQSTPRYSLN
jgi:hypothetical protein